MSSLSIKTVRFSNSDVLQNIEGVLSDIVKGVGVFPQRPPLLKEGVASKRRGR